MPFAFAKELRVPFLLLVWVAYVLTFPVMYGVVGVAAAAVAYLIVAGGAWWNGVRAGLTHGVLSLPAVVLGFLRVNGGELDVRMLLTGGTVSTLVAILLGLLIGHLRDLKVELARLAQTDALTGLLNRAAFTDLLERALERSVVTGRIVRVAYVDLDRFKSINDRYGHHVGDDVLRCLALRMRTDLSGLGTWGRLGGDEFVVLLHDSPNPTNVPDVVRRALSEPVTLGELDLEVGASVGQSEGVGSAWSAAGLLRAADQAMYAEKRGR